MLENNITQEIRLAMPERETKLDFSIFEDSSVLLTIQVKSATFTQHMSMNDLIRLQIKLNDLLNKKVIEA